jgi:hypothetical protein
MGDDVVMQGGRKKLGEPARRSNCRSSEPAPCRQRRAHGHRPHPHQRSQSHSQSQERSRPHDRGPPRPYDRGAPGPSGRSAGSVPAEADVEREIAGAVPAAQGLRLGALVAVMRCLSPLGSCAA